jgi:hypothetical protein
MKCIIMLVYGKARPLAFVSEVRVSKLFRYSENGGSMFFLNIFLCTSPYCVNPEDRFGEQHNVSGSNL